MTYSPVLITSALLFGIITILLILIHIKTRKTENLKILIDALNIHPIWQWRPFPQNTFIFLLIHLKILERVAAIPCTTEQCNKALLQQGILQHRSVPAQKPPMMTSLCVRRGEATHNPHYIINSSVDTHSNWRHAVDRCKRMTYEVQSDEAIISVATDTPSITEVEGEEVLVNLFY